MLTNVKRFLKQYPMAPWLLCCMLFYPMVFMYDVSDPMIMLYAVVLFVYSCSMLLIRFNDKSNTNYRITNVCYELPSFPENKEKLYEPSTVQRYLRIVHYIFRLLFVGVTFALIFIGVSSFVMPFDAPDVIRILAQLCLIIYACLYIEGSDNLFGYREFKL